MSRQYYPALRGRLGDWAFYSVLMTLRQLSEYVSYAKEIHNSEKLSDLIQRELDNERRAGEIGEYLLKNNDRFFNSLVVAVYGGDPEWHEFQSVRPVSRDIDLSEVNYGARYSVGFLSLAGSEKLFALDGQHRLAGVRNALQSNAELGDDEVSVIIVAHHNDPAGLRRTRKLFTTLNKTAKPVSKTEIIALDEADAMAITARALVESDPRFSDTRIDILRKQPNLPPTDSQYLLTLINVYDILEILFARGRGLKGEALKHSRPSDDALDGYLNEAQEYFSSLASAFAPLNSFFTRDPGRAVRKYRRPDGGHVLFRPVGLLIFTEVLAELRARHGLSFAEGMASLKRLPTDLGGYPYVDVLWMSSTGTMATRNRALTRELLLHRLGFLREPKRIRRLEERYAAVRGGTVDAFQLEEPLGKRA